MKHINDMTVSEFECLPLRGWGEDIGEFDSMVILPSEVPLWGLLKYKLIEYLEGKFDWFNSWYVPYGLHDSGYRCMDFVAVRNGNPICRLSGCSDVIHFNGIGGYGKNWLGRYKEVPNKVDPVSWSIDCLPKSGLLRIFSGGKLTCGSAISSFELYSDTENEL